MSINIDDAPSSSTTLLATATVTTTTTKRSRENSDKVPGGTKKQKIGKAYYHKNGRRSYAAGPSKNAWRPPNEEDMLESRAITYLMMSEIFLRLRLNEAQRLMCRSVFQRYESLRRNSPLMATNRNKEKNCKQGLSSSLNGVEIVPKMACTTILMDKLSKAFNDAPAFGNERKHIDKAGKFVSCDKDVGIAKGYKDRGLSNDAIIAKARKNLEALRNDYDVETIEKAEALIDGGIFHLGNPRQISKGKGAYY
jgi:hypothetical protein